VPELLKPAKKTKVVVVAEEDDRMKQEIYNNCLGKSE
jgi:hypothetical protein